MLRPFFRGVRRDFIRGLLVILPVFATFYLLWLTYRLFVRLADATVGPLLTGLLGSHWWISLIGVLLTIVLVWFLGLLTRNYVGHILHRYFEELLRRVPLVNKAYAMAKQVTDALLRPEVPAFKKVVLIQYPRKGIYTLAFVTREEPGKLGQALGEEFVAVYAPTSPNPLSGWFLLVPKEEVIYPNITVEEGLKLVISSGVIFPEGGTAAERPSPTRRSLWRWGKERVGARLEAGSDGGYNQEGGG
ncbi:MAG: DUF502 domain-containing protein [Candidatus Acetothermia bacterium]|jgi:uncharacterized membrane protein|nr:DUF502 domain-containing protein [Candidatus Acetothermia bacterium]MDH7504605.1 DUF502 domain-containing protein [Candidatus Acetothermia bacterium]